MLIAPRPRPLGHPFRRQIVLAPAPMVRDEDKDLKLFVLSFTAFFICFYSLIA